MGIGEDAKDTDNGVTLEAVKERKMTIRTEEEVKKMATKQYLDEMVVPTLNKALLLVNKERPVNPMEFLGHYLLKVANEPASPAEESSKSSSVASTPTPM